MSKLCCRFVASMNLSRYVAEDSTSWSYERSSFQTREYIFKGPMLEALGNRIDSLAVTLAAHALWLADPATGARADMTGADMTGPARVSGNARLSE